MFLVNEAVAGTLPLTGSEVAARWDSLYSFVLWLSVFMFVLVVGGMLYFTVAYRHKKGVKTKYITGNHLLEGIWIAVPTVLLLIIFTWGYFVYHSMTQAPSDAYEVRVIAKQWMWTFQYDNGKTTVGEVFVPLNRPVKFIMTSEDVLHSFFVPNFRVKQDVVPGMYSSVWFTPTVPGKHQIFCAEYCGTAHSEMLAKVNVLDEAQWEAWSRNKKIGPIPEAGKELTAADHQADQMGASAETVSDSAPKMNLVEQGKALYQQKGCVACHTTDGTKKIGPSHKGLFGRKVELADGRTVVADENYIRGHIENPNGSLVKGYTPMMPTFKGLLSAAEMNALVEYLKSLK